MTAHSREIEFKFAVGDRRAFSKLAAHLDLPDNVLDTGITQTNHFFDSNGLCLYRNHFAIRLREQGSRNLLTIKGEQQSTSNGHRVLSDRVEEEVELRHETAQALLQGSITPYQAIEQSFGDKSPALLQLISSACDRKDLLHIGKFKNVRIHLPSVKLDLGATDIDVEFELDTSSFPDGSVDHELEVEITDTSDLAGIQTALIEMLQQAGIIWHSAPSKAKRFFSALQQ